MASDDSMFNFDTAPAAETAGEVAATPASDKKKKGGKVSTAKRGKKKVARHVPTGQVHIQATYNNTIVTFSDLSGSVLSWSSAGVCGFKGPKKATPYAASVIVKDAFDKAKAYGLVEVAVFVKGVASGREGAIRALHANGLEVSGIKDITPIPHNGCRPKKVRRV